MATLPIPPTQFKDLAEANRYIRDLHRELERIISLLESNTLGGGGP